MWSTFLRRLALNGSIGEYVVPAVSGAFKDESKAILREAMHHGVFMCDERNDIGTKLSKKVTSVLGNADRVILAFDPNDATSLTDWMS